MVEFDCEEIEYSCSSDECIECEQIPGSSCDCTCQCKNEGSNNWHYNTQCGCSTNPTCPQDCPNTIHQYCWEYELETICGEVTGCTDPTASNYNFNATIDDGSCLYGGSDDNETGFESSIDIKYTFFSDVHPDDGQLVNDLNTGYYVDIKNYIENNCQSNNCPQINNYPHNTDSTRVIYADLKLHNQQFNQGMLTDVNDKIFVILNSQIRGVGNVTNPYQESCDYQLGRPCYSYLVINYKLGNVDAVNDVSEIDDDIQFYLYKSSTNKIYPVSTITKLSTSEIINQPFSISQIY